MVNPREYLKERRYEQLRLELQLDQKCGKAGLRRSHKSASFELQDLVIVLLHCQVCFSWGRSGMLLMLDQLSLDHLLYPISCSVRHCVCETPVFNCARM